MAFCSVMSALSVALMFFARLIGLADYCVVVVCCLVIGVIMIECGVKWAIASYVVTGGLGLLLGNLECALLFIFFFGFYPIIKPLIERLPRIVEWLLKLVLFNGVIVALYAAFDAIIAPADDVKYLSHAAYIVLLLITANVVFIMVDILFNKLMTLYDIRLHPRIKKLIG